MSDMPERQSLSAQIADATSGLAKAQEYLQRMSARVADARREETDAINKANEAQRHFDALVAEVKKSAPRDTEWRMAVGFSTQMDKNERTPRP